MKETPQEIVVFLRQYKSSLEIAKAVGCSQELINKIASGERQNPRYQIMDGLRDLAKAVKRKAPRGNVGQGLRREACNKRKLNYEPKTDTVQADC